MKFDRNVQQTNEQLLNHIAQSLESLRQLCTIYDRGHPYIAFTIASEVHRLLTANDTLRRLRGTKEFTTPDVPEDPENLLDWSKLVVADLTVTTGEVPRLSFQPMFRDSGSTTKELNFRDWWSRDVIYRASAAPPGTPPGLIPVRDEEIVPYEKRAKFVRSDFIETTRNKFGAHLDEETPEILDRLQKSESFGMGFRVELDGRIYSTGDNSIEVQAGMAAAMVRQIVEEVIRAYT